VSAVTRIRAEETIQVGHPSDQVWDVLSDVDSYEKWWPVGLTVSVTEPSRNLVGTEICVRPWLLRPFWIRFEEAEAEESLRIRFVGGVLEGPGYLRLSGKDGGTEVSGDIDVLARGFGTAMMSSVMPLHQFHAYQLRRVLRSMDRRLRHLQREGGRGPATAPADRARSARSSSLTAAKS